MRHFSYYLPSPIYLSSSLGLSLMVCPGTWVGKQRGLLKAVTTDLGIPLDTLSVERSMKLGVF